MTSNMSHFRNAMDSPRLSAVECGIKKQPPAFVVIYYSGSKKRIRMYRFTDPIKKSSDQLVSELLTRNPNCELVKSIPLSQLNRMMGLLRKSLMNENIISDIDFNRLSIEALNRKKESMDHLFNQNRILPGDPRYVYDKQIDFPDGTSAECSWDSDEYQM